MAFDIQERPSDSPFVEAIWQTHTNGGSFTSVAFTHHELVVTQERDKLCFTVRGPETIATPAPIPEDAEIFGIVLKHGTFLSPLPAKNLVDNPVNLPEASNKSFWLHGAAWEMPTFENADTFLARLVREGILLRDDIVTAVLQNQRPALSPRSLERRFVQATGLSQGAILQIERARQAAALLEQGVSILDVVEQTGYFDQPHLNRYLKRLMGQTPAQILKLNQPE
ncbi:MAG: helix-turn-helix transcriptional regulator [Chloroflexota bacterium]